MHGNTNVKIRKLLTTAYLVKWLIKHEIIRSLKVSGIDLTAMIRFGRSEWFDYRSCSSVFLLSLTSLAHSEKELNIVKRNNLVRILNSLIVPSYPPSPSDTSVV